MTEFLAEKRINYAHRYLHFDAFTQDLTWLESVKVFNSDPHLRLPELMVLIHPRFIRLLNLDIKLTLGADFPPNTTNGKKCRSREVWGYECPYINAKIHVDHSFPRSRGGVTHPLNAMYLCEQHNLMKSSDVHMYPWENLESNREWVEGVLNKLSTAEQRKTGITAHIPANKKYF